jgi:hypothetical protein
VTIRVDHLLVGILGIAVTALVLFFGAQRLLQHHHAGMAIQPGFEAGFIQKASANGEVAQCSPSTYEITCSYAGKDSVVHKVQITRVSFCTYALDGDTGSGTYNACAHKTNVTPSAHYALIAAESNVRQTIPDMEAYYADHSSYRGATASELRKTYDTRINPRMVTVVRVANPQYYCLQSTVHGQTASVRGPGGTIVARPCP